MKVKIQRMIDAHDNKIITEAHGGGKQKVIIETKKFIPEYSLLRRKI